MTPALQLLNLLEDRSLEVLSQVEIDVRAAAREAVS